MKKTISMLALVAFLFSMNGNAQEKEPKQKKKAKTEKSCTASEKKSCGKEEKGEKKGGCFMGKAKS